MYNLTSINLIILIKITISTLTVTTTTSSTSAGIYYAIGTVGGIILFILMSIYFLKKVLLVINCKYI